MDELLDEKLEAFAETFPPEHQEAFVDVFFDNVHAMIDFCAAYMGPESAIEYVQTRPQILFEDEQIDQDNVPWNTRHLEDLYVGYIVEYLKTVKLH